MGTLADDMIIETVSNGTNIIELQESTLGFVTVT
jgi:hypothetical protein